MKRILIALLLSIVIVTPCLAEAPSSTAAPSSAADEFLTNLSATWNSLVKLGEETANNVVNWVNNDLDNWLKNDLPAWADNAAKSIQSWIGEADKWTQDAAAKLQAFVEQNGPAVEAWLNQAGEDVQKAWETLNNPNAHTQEEVEQAYDAVMNTLQEVGAVNPWVEQTEAELRQRAGAAFHVPEDAKEVVYRWLESDKLAEMQFKIDGDEYCARMQPAELENGQLMNISGMYFAWENEEAVIVGNCHGTIGLAQTGSREWVELCQWYDAAARRMYSLSVYTTDPDGLDLIAVADMVYQL